VKCVECVCAYIQYIYIQTHAVQPMAVMSPAVSLHQHLGQTVGVVGLGAHGHQASLYEAGHLGRRDQTPGTRGETQQSSHFRVVVTTMSTLVELVAVTSILDTMWRCVSIHGATPS